MKRHIKIFAILAVVALSSCDMLDQEPETAVTNTHIWSSEKDAVSVFVSMQYSLRHQSSSAHFWLLGDVRARNFDNCSNFIYQHFFNNSFELLTGSGAYNWSEYYTTIGLANLIVDNIGRTPMDAGKKKYLLGSAHFARAMSYFNILRFWGEAPLIVISDDVTTTKKATRQAIFDQVIADAKAAQEHLQPWSGIPEQMGESIYSKQYACRGAADALMAHAYAWMGSLENNDEYLRLAVERATDVIDSPEYGLMATPEEVVTETMKGNSKEGIFELEFNEYEKGGSATLGYYIVGYPVILNLGAGSHGNWPYYEYIIRNDLVESVYDESADLRLNSYYYDFYGMKAMDESITLGRAYPYKWRIPVYSTDGSNMLMAFNANMVVFRLADIILLRAEVRNRLGETSPAEADLNRIRTRAGLGNYSAVLHGDLKQAILKERRRELMYEGHYFFDLVRNGELRNKVSTFAEMTDQDIADGCYYLPVPAGAFTKNPEMRQNLYWKRNGF